MTARAALTTGLRGRSRVTGNKEDTPGRARCERDKRPSSLILDLGGDVQPQEMRGSLSRNARLHTEDWEPQTKHAVHLRSKKTACTMTSVRELRLPIPALPTKLAR